MAESTAARWYMVSMSCFLTASVMVCSFVRSICSHGPVFCNSSLGGFLCVAAMTFCPPCFFLSSRVSSDPICPVEPVTRIFFMFVLLVRGIVSPFPYDREKMSV